MVICPERGADLHIAQLMPLPLAVSCFSKIQIGFAFLVPAHPGSPRQRAVKHARARVRACVCVCVRVRVWLVGSFSTCSERERFGMQNSFTNLPSVLSSKH